MAKDRTTSDGVRNMLATLAVGATLLVACGTTSQALSGTAESSRHAAVVRDPDNPYWVGSTVRVTDAAVSRQSVIRDPDNPYWQPAITPDDTSDAATETTTDLRVRGPR